MKPADFFFFNGYLKRLFGDSRIGISKITSTIISNFETPESDGKESVAWGQFLDESRPSQYGLYGTSAAVEALAYETTDESTRLIKMGKDFLLRAFRTRGVSAGWNYDFSLTLKSCCFLNAFTQQEFVLGSHSSNWCTKILNFFKSSMLEDGSWGFYYCNNNTYDSNGAIVPTCYVLLSLDNKKMLGSIGDFRKSLRWLEKRLNRLEVLHAYEVALILTTIQSLDSHFIKKDLLKKAKKYIRTQVLSNPIIWTENLIEYISVRPDTSESRYENEYYVMKGGFIILEYLFRFDHFTLFHPTVVKRIENIIENIDKNNGYRSLNGRIATRQNLRALKSLVELQQIITDEMPIKIYGFILINAISTLAYMRSLIFMIVLFGVLFLVPLNGLNIGRVNEAVVISIISGILLQLLFPTPK